MWLRITKWHVYSYRLFLNFHCVQYLQIWALEIKVSRIAGIVCNMGGGLEKKLSSEYTNARFGKQKSDAYTVTRRTLFGVRLHIPVLARMVTLFLQQVDLTRFRSLNNLFIERYEDRYLPCVDKVGTHLSFIFHMYSQVMYHKF